MSQLWRVAVAALALDAALGQTEPGCRAGQGTNGVLPGVCSDCPAGRQSHAGGVDCTDCAELTVPNRDQAGCVCQVARQGRCSGGCTPGHECTTNHTSGAAECTQCPEGKQSQDGVSPCSYCRFTLRPTAAQDGCECAELTFDVRNWTRAIVDSPCTACSAVTVHKAGGESGQCQASGTLRACGKDESAVGGGRSRCDNSGAQCECSGGARGEASLCAREGFFVRTLDGTTPSESVSVVQCVGLRGKRSRCQHWSRCYPPALQQADIRWGEDDPYGKWVEKESLQEVHGGYSQLPDGGSVGEGDTEDGLHYIDDYEFARWLNTSAGQEARCPHAQPCCAPGFEGDLCDYCEDEHAMRIGQSCVECSVDGYALKPIISGVLMSFGFTIFIMRKAAQTFEDADGTIAIAIFYFQIVALLFKDRAAEFGWFLVDLVSFMELGFLRNTETTCVIKLDFYANFYFSIFSTLIVVGLAAGTLIAVCTLTSRQHTHSREIVSVEAARSMKVVEHLLFHIPLFESCNGAEVGTVAAGMTFHGNMGKHHVIKNESDPKGLFVVVISGSIEVHHVSGRRSKGDTMGVYTAGHHYGEGALFSHGSKHIRIRTGEKGTSVMALTKAKFMKLRVEGRLICEIVIDKAYQLEREQDSRLLETGMSRYDLDDSSTMNMDEAEDWLRARRFDPSKPFLLGLFKKFDTNSNGEISMDDFKQVLKETDKLEDHFNHFDVNDSGTIDTDELGHLMTRCGQTLSRMGLRNLVKELDSNGSGEIDFDEFCEMMLERELKIARESLDNHYDAAIHSGIEGGEAALIGFSGIRRYTSSEQQEEEEAVMNTEAVIEREEHIERALMHSFQKLHQQKELSTTIEVSNSWCKQLQALMKTANMELMHIYVACSDPTARKCAVLEMAIALYGPLSLVAMSVLFCWKIDGKEVLVVDSTQECWKGRHTTAAVFASLFLLMLTVGCPLVMWYAANSFYSVVGDHDKDHKHATEVAKARNHSHWKTMSKRQKEKEIDECAHELRLEIMGAHSFLLTSFQMSVTRQVANWYPQWHLLRRTILNFLYFEGLRSSGGQVRVSLPLLVSFRADWRVLVVVVLAGSNLLQTFFRVFRDVQEDRLEMWALHFLLVVVVIDIANEEISLYLCLILSGIFGVIVLKDIFDDKRNQRASNKEWTTLRKLALVGQSTGQKDATGRDVVRTLKEADQRGEMMQQVEKAKAAINKSANTGGGMDKRKFTNPLMMMEKRDSDDESDASTDEETVTPTSKGGAQLQLIQASARLGTGATLHASRSVAKAETPLHMHTGAPRLAVTSGEAHALERE